MLSDISWVQNLVGYDSTPQLKSRQYRRGEGCARGGVIYFTLSLKYMNGLYYRTRRQNVTFDSCGTRERAYHKDMPHISNKKSLRSLFYLGVTANTIGSVSPIRFINLRCESISHERHILCVLQVYVMLMSCKWIKGVEHTHAYTIFSLYIWVSGPPRDSYLYNELHLMRIKTPIWF